MSRRPLSRRACSGRRAASPCSRSRPGCRTISYARPRSQVGHDEEEGMCTPLPFVVIHLDSTRGCGIVATRHILQGELLFTERPLLSVSREFSFPLSFDATLASQRAQTMLTSGVDDAVGRLGTAERAIFDGLSCSTGETTSIGIFKTNAFETGSSGSVFPTISRINHSCCPNVLHDWHPCRGVLSLRAAHDIELGSELTIAYNAQCLPCNERRAFLQREFGFVCECELCLGG